MFPPIPSTILEEIDAIATPLYPDEFLTAIATTAPPIPEENASEFGDIPEAVNAT